jgi:hypothetical protein
VTQKAEVSAISLDPITHNDYPTDMRAWAIVTTQDGLVVGITRQTNAVVVEPPGGPVGRGETVRAALQRIVLEQTGIRTLGGWSPVRQVSPTDSVSVFVMSRLPQTMRSRPFKGVVGFYLPRDLVDLSPDPNFWHRVFFPGGAHAP